MAPKLDKSKSQELRSGLFNFAKVDTDLDYVTANTLQTPKVKSQRDVTYQQ